MHELTDELFKDQFGQFLLSQHVEKFDSIIRQWLEEAAKKLYRERECRLPDGTPKVIAFGLSMYQEMLGLSESKQTESYIKEYEAGEKIECGDMVVLKDNKIFLAKPSEPTERERLAERIHQYLTKPYSSSNEKTSLELADIALQFIRERK